MKILRTRMPSARPRVHTIKVELITEKKKNTKKIPRKMTQRRMKKAKFPTLIKIKTKIKIQNLLQILLSQILLLPPKSLPEIKFVHFLILISIRKKNLMKEKLLLTLLILCLIKIMIRSFLEEKNKSNNPDFFKKQKID